MCGHSPLEGNVAEWFRHSSLEFRIPAKAQPLCCSSLPLCEAKFNQAPSLSGTLCTQGWTYVHVDYKTDACQSSWSISLGHNTKLFTNRMIPLNLLLNDISPPPPTNIGRSLDALLTLQTKLLGFGVLRTRSCSQFGIICDHQVRHHP